MTRTVILLLSQDTWPRGKNYYFPGALVKGKQDGDLENKGKQIFAPKKKKVNYVFILQLE